MKIKDKNNYKFEVEDENNVIKTGEFVTSYFKWISLDTQKENTRKFENITNVNNDNKEGKNEI